jgi:hypothetical protein
LHFYADLFCRLPIAGVFPAAINHDISDGFLDRARTLDRLAARNQRRGNDNGLTAHNRPRFAHVDINIDFAFESQALDRLLRLRANFVVVRTLVHNRGVVIRDVGDVGRLIDEGHVALGPNDRAFEPRRAKLFCFDKAILVRTDVVITVRPIVDAGPAIEARFRR